MGKNYIRHYKHYHYKKPKIETKDTFLTDLTGLSELMGIEKYPQPTRTEYKIWCKTSKVAYCGKPIPLIPYSLVK